MRPPSSLPALAIAPLLLLLAPTPGFAQSERPAEDPAACAAGYINLRDVNATTVPALADGLVAIQMEIYSVEGDIAAALSATVTDPMSAEVPGSLTWDPGALTAYWRPDAPLTEPGTYTLDFAVDATDLTSDCAPPQSFSTQLQFTNDGTAPTNPSTVELPSVRLEPYWTSASTQCCPDNATACWADAYEEVLRVTVEGNGGMDLSPFLSPALEVTFDGQTLDEAVVSGTSFGQARVTANLDQPYPLPVCATFVITNVADGTTASSQEVCVDVTGDAGPEPEVTALDCSNLGNTDVTIGMEVADGGSGSSDGCECNSVRATESQGPTPLGLLGATAALLGLVSLARRRR